MNKDIQKTIDDFFVEHEEEGWISLYRCLLKKAIWKISTPEQKVILITLLLMANHKEKEWAWQGEKFKVPIGGMITSLKNIKKNAGKNISFQKIRTFLEKFQKYGFLTNESTKTGRMIIIENFKEYQGIYRKINKDDNKQVTNNQQTGNKQVTTNNNDNNDNKLPKKTDTKKIKKLIQKKKYLDFVLLAEGEYKKLTDKVGKEKTDGWISKLNNHIGSVGDKYKSHYYTILKWIQKEPSLKEGKRYDRL